MSRKFIISIHNNMCEFHKKKLVISVVRFISNFGLPLQTGKSIELIDIVSKTVYAPIK